MKKSWQLLLVGLLAIGLTFVGAFIALANNIEEPPYDGELLAIATVALCNLVWFVPWTTIQLRRKDNAMVIAGLILLGLCWLPFPVGYFHHPSFDPITWKSSFDYNNLYVDERYPAHKAGHMVPDIIESGMCIGKTKTEIESLLGTDHFHEIGLCDSCFAYFYSGGGLFDGCNKLALRFENGRCIGASFWGCD